MKESQLVDALENLDKFKELFKCYFNLSLAMKGFPQHAEALARLVVSNSDEFDRLIFSSNALCYLAEQNSEYADVFIAPVLSNPDIFKRVFVGSEYLCMLGKAFPQHADALMGLAFRDIVRLKLCMSNSLYHLHKLISAFPDHADTLIWLVLSDLDIFKKLSKDFASLCTLAQKAPRHADTFIGLVLSDPDEFTKCLSANFAALFSLIKEFPRHAAAVVKVIISNPDIFKLVFNSHRRLNYTLRNLPQYAAIFMRQVLSDPDVVKCIFDTKDPFYLPPKPSKLAEILNKNSADEAVIAAADYIARARECSAQEILKNIKIIIPPPRIDSSGKSTPRKSGLFSMLPTSVKRNIAACTGNPIAHTQGESRKIAQEYINGFIVNKSSGPDGPDECKSDSRMDPGKH